MDSYFICLYFIHLFLFFFSVTVCYFKNVSSAIQCLKPIIFPPCDSNILHTTFLFLLYIKFCKSLPLSSRVSFSLNPECVDLDSLSLLSGSPEEPKFSGSSSNQHHRLCRDFKPSQFLPLLRSCPPWK